MKALQFTGYGDIIKNVISSEIDRPTTDKDEVLNEAHIAEINPLDYKVIGGVLRRVRKFRLPGTSGHDINGKIVVIREDVKNFKIGVKVFKNE